MARHGSIAASSSRNVTMSSSRAVSRGWDSISRQRRVQSSSTRPRDVKMVRSDLYRTDDRSRSGESERDAGALFRSGFAESRDAGPLTRTHIASNRQRAAKAKSSRRRENMIVSSLGRGRNFRSAPGDYELLVIDT